MLELKYSQSTKPHRQTVIQSTTEVSVLDKLDALQRADRSLAKMIGMEVWSIAKTMDDLCPGFWNQFMNNRRLAMKNFLDQKQAVRSEEHPFLNDSTH